MKYKTIGILGGMGPEATSELYINIIRIYQKNISRRLGVPTGARKDKNIVIPRWIKVNKEYLKRYLRGLYEAEGSFCVHKPTCTYKFLFSNRNKSLLKNVFWALKFLGFHPHGGSYKIQISRRKEVYKIKEDMIRIEGKIDKILDKKKKGR